METLEMLLSLQQHHRRKCPPKKQECFLAGLVCNWARALLEHSVHVASLRDSNQVTIRETQSLAGFFSFGAVCYAYGFFHMYALFFLIFFFEIYVDWR